MSVVKRWDWLVCVSLAAALGLAAPRAFAASENAAAMKPVIAGFIDMQTISWHNEDDGQPIFTLANVRHFPGVFGGIVFNATWAEMQHQQGGPLTTVRLDNALKQVRQYNLAHPTAPLGVKLRIFSGNQAPPWAKALAGGPLTIQRNPQGCPSGNCPITIGKVWNTNYIAAWRAFQRMVAARYDSEPLIRSVAITSCTMETDEPFVMPVDQPVPTGYTDAAGMACLRGAVTDYAAWRSTAIDFTINAFDKIQMGGSNPNFSFAIMNECRSKLGSRCELGNHAFAASMPKGNTAIVAAIAARGAPIHYQTVGPKVAGFNWTTTVQAAREDNATGLELWPDKNFGGFMTLTMAQMLKLSVLFNGTGGR
ncbi:MAG: hypothetical protein ACRECC_05650 [Pseudolabrys sp.]